MAAIAGTFVANHDQTGTGTWALGNADTGNAMKLSRYRQATVHVVGTFGAATVTIQGSNDNTNWVTLNDDLATPVALTFTATGMKNIRERPAYIRAITAGGSGTALTVIINVSLGD